MNEYKVQTNVLLKVNKTGWKQEPIAEGVTAQDRTQAIEEYKETVEKKYVKNGKFYDADFSYDDDDYSIQKINGMIQW